MRSLIYQRAGISLNAGKQAMVYSRLSRRLRETGHANFADYLQWLQQGGGGAAEAEWQEFVNCLTTNLTAFFRDDHHFSELADDLRARAGRSLRIWCSATSTGEEPYSIAMTVAETLGAQAKVRIVASDIDTKVLATAERGVYDAAARGLSAERLRRHFMRGNGANAGQVRIRPELARCIEFRPFNLMSANWALGEPFDIIVCRNVMIRSMLPPSARCCSTGATCCAPTACCTWATRRTSTMRASCFICAARRSTNAPEDPRPTAARPERRPSSTGTRTSAAMRSRCCRVSISSTTLTC